MDREQFDALTRLIGLKGTRRSALVALLGAVLLHQDLESALAGGHKGKGKGKHHKRHKHKRRRRRRSVAPPPRVIPRPLTPVAVNCFPGTNCNFPGAGVVAKGCDFSGSTTFRDLDASGGIFSGSNFSNADLSGADFQGALLDGACLVGADLHKAHLDTSTLLEGAIFCNTIMPDGSINDTGCSHGTSCCPTAISSPNPPQGRQCRTIHEYCGLVLGECCSTECMGGILSRCERLCANSGECQAAYGPDAECVSGRQPQCGNAACCVRKTCQRNADCAGGRCCLGECCYTGESCSELDGCGFPD
jgi:uncharacterized protein YjbI with pentapeptide repeats